MVLFLLDLRGINFVLTIENFVLVDSANAWWVCMVMDGANAYLIYIY